MIQARFEIDEHTARVLDVIKGKYGLKNRDEALRRLALETEDKYVELKANELVLRELDEIYETHKKEHKNRKMINKDLKRLLNV
jgi:hypothetical protein